MTNQEARAKAKELVKKMTLEEQCSQMLYESPAIERLGLPEYNWWNEALHGVARAGLATMFPQAIALAATFDEHLVHEVGSAIGVEGRIKNEIFRSENDRDIYKGLTFWSPNINIVRDPRWGRSHETYGEDPFLTSVMGCAFVNGVQKEDEYSRPQASACVKHFAVHSGPEGIRHGFNVNVSKRDLNETYLPHFERVIRDAKPDGLMTAYNAVNGVPTSANEEMIRRIARNKWGFDGYVVSDCGAISDIYDFHHYTDTKVEAAGIAAQAGLELNCGNMYGYLLQAVEKGYVTKQRIEEAVEDLLTIRLKLRMDDTIEDASEAIEKWLELWPIFEELSKRAAVECQVLLKNNGILPLKNEGTIAVIGPNARSVEPMKGNYHGTAEEIETPYTAMKKAFPNARFLVSEGSHLYKDRLEMCCKKADDGISEAVAYARYADVSVLFLGLDPTMEGEQGDANNAEAAGDKSDLYLPESQRHLLKAVCDASEHVVVVLLSGSALDLGEENDRVDAVLQGWYPGSKGAEAIAEVLAGRSNPTGRLPETFYRNEQVNWDFSDYEMDGKTYRFLKNKPLYPFGFGLSYEKLTLSDFSVEKGQCIFTASNPYDHRVAMPIELYVKATEEGLRTPNYQLVGFARIVLEAGESITYEMKIPPFWIMVVDEEGIRRPCRGTLTYYLGDHQPDERSQELTGESCLEF